MHERYEDSKIKQIWSEENRLNLWQRTELAVIKAEAEVTGNPEIVAAYREIEEIWNANPIDIKWWKERDDKIRHDLNAFLHERIRHLSANLQKFVHKKITSYDTEEPAFARMLIDSVVVTDELYFAIEETLVGLARKYRHTIMNARTHGQEAELQSFGARCLTWKNDLEVASMAVCMAMVNLGLSKISGAIGKYGSIDPRVEDMALEFLGFAPFYGATQIMPRILYLPLASALCGVV